MSTTFQLLHLLIVSTKLRDFFVLVISNLTEKEEKMLNCVHMPGMNNLLPLEVKLCSVCVGRVNLKNTCEQDLDRGFEGY